MFGFFLRRTPVPWHSPIDKADRIVRAFQLPNRKLRKFRLWTGRTWFDRLVSLEKRFPDITFQFELTPRQVEEIDILYLINNKNQIIGSVRLSVGLQTRIGDSVIMYFTLTVS